MAFLDKLIGFEHRVLAQTKQAKKLKHSAVMQFAAGLTGPAQEVIALARSWQQILEAENEHEDD